MRKILLILMLLTAPLGAYAEELSRKMTLTGVGQVFVAPDMATIGLGVSSFNAEASVAMSQNAAQMQKVFKALTDQGIEMRDIQTSQLSLNPRWDRGKTNKQPQIIGYDAVNTVNVRVRDLDNVGVAIDTLTKAGANRINSIQFGIQKPQPHQDKARWLAVQDAKSKADLYADAAGVTLGQIITISELGAVSPPRAMSRMASAMDAEAVPIAQGELGLTSNVTIVFEIK